jgi:inner membrane protein
VDNQEGDKMTGFFEGLGRIMRTPTFKFILVGILILVLSIPLLLVYLLVYERSSRSVEVVREISSHWGRDQALQGPYLIVPYTVKIVSKQDEKSVERLQERHAIFLPETLTLKGNAQTSVKHRSIFNVTVYQTKLAADGKFAAPAIEEIDPDVSAVRWRDSVLAFGLTDVSGLKEAGNLAIGSQSHAFEPSLGVAGVQTNGIHTKPFRGMDASAQGLKDKPEAFEFHTELSFNGTSSLSFAPVARTTTVNLESNWGSPSFTGAFLPGTCKVTPDGFSAEWKVPHLARSVRQAWTETPSNYGHIEPFNNYLFGAKFFVPVDYYNLTDRAAKYGMMFILVTFCTILVMELRSPVRVHAVQYIFAGIALIFFYVLQLSFAEHIGFTPAYIIAATATGSMLSVYTGMAFRNAGRGAVMLALFAFLYGLLYLILRLEDYALLAGAIAGFILITIGMFATLRVNWSADKAGPQPQPQ